MTTTKAVRVSLLHDAVRRKTFAEASRFRGEFYECLTVRRDALFELADAVLCADGAVKFPVDLTLLSEHRRGHGAMYDVNGRLPKHGPELRCDKPETWPEPAITGTTN